MDQTHENKEAVPLKSSIPLANFIVKTIEIQSDSFKEMESIYFGNCDKLSDEEKIQKTINRLKQGRRESYEIWQQYVSSLKELS